MREETLHNTLVFIGEIDQSRLEALKLSALEVSASRFELSFEQAHYWGHNRIVYAAPDQVPPRLMQLHDVLAQCLSRHQFSFDQREYQPHITLIRNALPTDELLPELQPVSWQVKDFALVQSEQQDGQPNYRVLARFPLKPSQENHAK